MHVQRYSKELKSVWNSFVNEAKNATFLFDRDYMDYHSERFEDFSLIVFNEKKIVALLPANVQNNNIHSHQGLSYGGVITKTKTSFQDSIKIYITILEFLNDQKIQALHLKLFPTFYCHQPSDEANYFMYLLQAKKTRCDVTLAINKEHKLNFNRAKKRHISLAQKNNLRIEQSNNFNLFWSNVLINNLNERHGVTPVHTAEEIKRLHQNFPEKIKLYVVYKDQDIIAGAVMYLTERVAHAQYSSTNQLGKETGAIDFLFHYLINEKYTKHETFNFGIVNQGEGINLGLTFWKEGFGARTYCHDFYEINPKNVRFLKDLLPTD